MPATQTADTSSTPVGSPLAAALARAQGQIKGAVKDSTNPGYKSKYADLASVWDACRKALADNGLAVVQFTQIDTTGPILVTRLLHVSGESEQGVTPLLMGKQDMQALGSAITYARRYGLAAMVGVAPEDDDGNAAVAGGEARPMQSRMAAPKAPEGFDAWALEMSKVAGEGLEPLRAAWKDSPEACRAFASAEFTDGLKLKATAAEEAKKARVAS
jgi:hypothetical protein